MTGLARRLMGCSNRRAGRSRYPPLPGGPTGAGGARPSSTT
ncbi:hypothetical protein N177_4060 [Lutibaculum baratangense AMV1]|uniref:Uncharacterized protein n=1 Tax=Lutibaculum baratangense AMV1 TaxID=631454 RepID=V4T8Q1_9HYPH|nr:hypothetical protein N177_4060 [Lutibaculum baratangense AMV1]